MPYVELHCHSSFSFLDGASSPRELAERAAELGYPALALTDHDGVWGSMEFAFACKEFGIRPITGAELTVAAPDGWPERDLHLTLLVENGTGYSNLCRLLTAAHAHTRDGRDRRPTQPRVPLSALAGRAEGLVCLTGCARQGIASVWAEAPSKGESVVRSLREWFGPKHLRLEIQRPYWRHDNARNRWLAELSRRLEVPLVATGNVHSHVEGRAPLQDALVAVRLGTGLAGSEPARRGNPSSSMVSPNEMSKRFPDHPEAVRETARLAERLSFDIERELGYRYPQQGDPQADQDLAELCRGRLLERYRDGPESEARSRLEDELRIIRRQGLSGFFLLHHDLLELARDVAAEVRGPDSARNVLPPGRGRGSSVSSIVCYLTGLSHIDPVKAELFTGRFLNDEMETVPDIDLDFPRDIREQLIPRIHARYGRDRSALVAAFPTYRSRGAIRDFGKVLGVPQSEIERVARAVDVYGSDDFARDLTQAIGPERANSLAWRKLGELCREARSLPRHASQHSGGMVISTGPLTGICPIVPTAMEERQIVQWDKDSCNDAGFLKIDLLGLGMLSSVERTIDEIHRVRGETIDLSRIKLDDKEVFRMIQRGETTGVFQIESRAQMQILPRMRPDKIEDLTVQVALIRPGPIQGGAVHPYVERRRRVREDPGYEVPFAHELLRPILGDTHGVIIFQEQVVEVAMGVAGYTTTEAEGLRRAMSRKRSRRAMEDQQQRFVKGAVAKGVPEDVAAGIFDQIIGFSGFGFPKAHSAAFGLLAYQSAWLKLHYGPEYLASLLNEQPMGFYPPDSLVQEAKRTGVEVLPPDVNHSRVECHTEWPSTPVENRSDDPAVRIGLGYVKGTDESEMEKLVAERDRGGAFRDLGDLTSRLPLRQTDLEQLAWAGALRSLPRGERVAGLWSVGLAPGRRSTAAGRQLALPFPAEETPELPEPRDWDRVQAEYGSIGMTLEGHPMALARDLIPDAVLSTTGAADRPDGSWVEVAGLQVARQRPETANGVIFILIEDEFGTLNLVLAPPVAKRHRLVVRTATLIRARGRIETRQGVVNMLVRGLEEIHPPNPRIKAIAPVGFNFGRRGR